MLDAIRERTPQSRVVVLTGYATPELEDELLNRGVAMVLHKPVVSTIIIDAVMALIEELEREASPAEVDVEGLYDEMQRKLYNIARKRFGLSHQSAEDVIQQAWLLFLQRRGLIREARPWLAGHRRQPVAATDRQGRSKARAVDDDMLIAIPDNRQGSLTETIAVRDALARTDDRTRMLCSMIALQGHSYDEVSTATGIPMGSIGPLYIRAKKRLRRMLEN